MIENLHLSALGYVAEFFGEAEGGGEGLGGLAVGGEAAHGQVHLGQLVGGGGELLSVDGDVLGVAVVAADELEGLHEHAA